MIGPAMSRFERHALYLTLTLIGLAWSFYGIGAASWKIIPLGLFIVLFFWVLISNSNVTGRR